LYKNHRAKMAFKKMAVKNDCKKFELASVEA
jgi:hypothetical protein